MSKTVAKKEAQFVTERPDWMGDGSRGNEGVGSEDMAIPRLSIAQDLSPQIKASKPEYIEGCKAGMCFNSATNELYGESVILIPVMFRKEFVIWRDRKKGGGFEGSYRTFMAANAALSELESPNDCQITDTAMHFCLLQRESGELEQVVLSMARSQMKPSRTWNTKITSVGGDRWSKAYRAEVVTDSNKNGDEYYNWRIDPIGYVSKSEYEAASRFYDTLKENAAEVDFASEVKDEDIETEF